MSIVIWPSEGMTEVTIVAAEAAVTEVSSLASILNLVPKTETPFRLISTITVDPVAAVVKLARTPDKVNARSTLNVSLAVPAVSA